MQYVTVTHTYMHIHTHIGQHQNKTLSKLSPSTSNAELVSSARGPSSLHLPQNLVCFVFNLAFFTTLVILAINVKCRYEYNNYMVTK